MSVDGTSVRLKTAARDMHVTHQVEDLSYRIVVPGGFASATVSLQRPLSLTPPELAYYGTLYVYDEKSGETLWEGRVEDLGRGSDAHGQIWTVNAVGPSAQVQDLTTPLLYQITDLSGWSPAQDAAPWMQAQTINTSGFGPGIQLTVPRGVVVAPGGYPGWWWPIAGDAGIDLAQLSLHFGTDFTDSSWSLELHTSTTDGGTQTLVYFAFFVAGSSIGPTIDTLPAGARYVYLMLKRYTTTTTVATDTLTASFTNLTFRSTMFDKTGTLIPVGAGYGALTVSQVVADVFGRMLPGFDGANAVIDTSVDYTITEQCAYPGGVNAGQVLADMMLLLPTQYWAAWESNPITGKNRCEWSPWPTQVRYIVTAEDGFTSPGSAADLYDQVTVRWIDPLGNTRNDLFTLDNPILDAAGLHRTAFLDLGSPIGGHVAATQAGNQFLAEHAIPPNAGTLRISRPIYDAIAMREVPPRAIRPGALIRVRDVQATLAGLTGGRDGTTTFRIVAVDFSQSDGTATLELDSPAPTLSNFLNAAAASAAAHMRN